MIDSILHASVIVSDLEKSLDFYQNILQLEQDFSRPDLGYPGAWLTVGYQQIHLMLVPNPYQHATLPPHGGRDRHTAFATHNLDKIVQQLELHNVPFTKSKSGRSALFCRDPDGNALEFIQI